MAGENVPSKSPTHEPRIHTADEATLVLDTIDQRQLIALAGGAGAGKSTFAARRFLPTQIVSSDRCRAMLADDEDVRGLGEGVFELMDTIVRLRMELGKVVVTDFVNLEQGRRLKLLGMARAAGYRATLLVLTADLATRRRRNRQRSRQVADEALVAMDAELRRTLAEIESEPWDAIYLVAPVEPANDELPPP